MADARVVVQWKGRAMRPTVAEKRSAFGSLHREGCFVLPNPWDLGSARVLQEFGFAALATTSSGFAVEHGAARLRFGERVTLVARTEILLNDASAISVAIDKLVAFADAGADCLYAPGVVKAAYISAMVRAVARRSVNVLITRPGLSVTELSDLSVRRISVGGRLARVTCSAVRQAAERMMRGSFEGLGAAMPDSTLNALFEAFVPEA